MTKVQCFLCKYTNPKPVSSQPKEGSEFYYICESCHSQPTSTDMSILQTIQKQLADIQTENAFLRREMAELKQQNLYDIISAIVPEIISTIQQQEENSKFMVVAGLPETNQEGDIQAVRLLCEELGSQDVEKEITESFRIGPHLQGRPRLMKVGFVSSSVRNNKLKNGKNLKHYGGGKIYIRPSMTRKQRELQKGMIDKAKLDRSEGKAIQVRTDFHGNPYYFDIDNRTKLGGRQANF